MLNKKIDPIFSLICEAMKNKGNQKAIEGTRKGWGAPGSEEKEDLGKMGTAMHV